MHGSGSWSEVKAAAASIAHSIYLTHSTSLNRYKSTSKIPKGWTESKRTGKHCSIAIHMQSSHMRPAFRWIFAKVILCVCERKSTWLIVKLINSFARWNVKIRPMQWRVKSHRDMAWNRDHRDPTFTCFIHQKRMKLKCSSLASTIITATLRMALAIALAPK